MSGFTITGGGSFSGGFAFTEAPLQNTAAWFGGANLSTVDRVTFATDTATASVRGPLSLARQSLAAASNLTDGWFGGGLVTTPAVVGTSRVDRITYATDTATASVRGPLSLTRYTFSATGNTTDGWFGGGLPGPVSTVDRITYATDTATASVRGPLSRVLSGAAAAGNSDYGWFSGGMIATLPYNISTVNRITYATDTNTASVRGPLSGNQYVFAAAGNDTDGWFGGGRPGFLSTVQRITYATDTATASVRGPLSLGRNGMGAAGNLTDGWFGGGVISPASVSTVDRITYATDTATASVRGPLSSAKNYLAAAGGIQ